MKQAVRPPSALSLPANISSLTIDRKSFEEIRKKSFPRELPDAKPAATSHENRDPNTFSTRYTRICQSLHTQPLNMVRVLQSNISLNLICDRIKFVNMMAILKTIREDRSLHNIVLISKLHGFVIQEHINTEKKAREGEKVIFTRYMVNQIGESIGECLKQSTNLTALRLEGIPMEGHGIELLAEGLSCTQSLQHLSLYKCNIGNAGCFVLSRSLKNTPTLLTMDLSFNNISAEGASHIANLIKFQELARFDQNWKQSLRFREANNDDMKGLRRVTLNDNTEIGDEGLGHIVDVLMDDFWIRALDVQNCGVTDIGGKQVLKMIEANSEIGIVDLRRNPLVSCTIFADLVRALKNTMTPEKAEYGWLNISKKKVNISACPSNATIVSYKNSTPWNSGPGRGNKNVEKDGSAGSEDNRKQSIMKVIEWAKQKKLENRSSSSSEESKTLEMTTSEQAEDSPSVSSGTSSAPDKSPERNNDSLIIPIENHPVRDKKLDVNDIELLFTKCMSESAFQD